MGSSKGWKSLGGGLLDMATGGSYSQKKLGKQQARAAEEMAQAMNKVPTPASSEIDVDADASANTYRGNSRRYKLSDTARSLGGLRKTLG